MDFLFRPLYILRLMIMMMGLPRTNWRGKVTKYLQGMGLTCKIAEAAAAALNRKMVSECDPMHTHGRVLNKGPGDI